VQTSLCWPDAGPTGNGWAGWGVRAIHELLPRPQGFSRGESPRRKLYRRGLLAACLRTVSAEENFRQGRFNFLLFRLPRT